MSAMQLSLIVRGQHPPGDIAGHLKDDLALVRRAEALGFDGVERRHIGFVVDDRASVKARAEAAGARMVPGPFLDFLDPWGNRIEVIEYSNIQFTKAPHVLRGMGLALDKNANARKELADKGMAPE